ncbi:type IV secretory system conjugative DNA transfer family protein [Acidithiobacillus montserratensis]|uniref:Type IV secretory system conjugative DNA transfer family protein n=1 Tax=Acidithiobacillus montserratensis TaxID=2729135 RepID=A0ACD5HI32_9PROT|nr:type IV secretory system conjugative DNA transfer family protein [Acidithiobacillus montserratensis]MBU2749204.1 type IV secretory system conjugative DNA transfer family protein [Acidithiobacillus montserratensis]
MAQKIHAPDQQVFDYQTQRLARGGKLKTTLSGVAAGVLGFTLGISYVARDLFPGYAWTDAFIKESHAYILIPFSDGWRLYNPIPFLRPMIFNLHYPVIHQALYYAGLPAVVMGMLTAGILSKKHKDAQQAVLNNPVHGSAHWATRKDAERAALLPSVPEKGILDHLYVPSLLGMETPYSSWIVRKAAREKAANDWYEKKVEDARKATEETGEEPKSVTKPEIFDRYHSPHVCYVGAFVENGVATPLQHTGAEHILVFAPTRSGKGVGLVLPTLLDGWMDSIVVHDIKGENFSLTAGYRKSQGHHILKFAPGSTETNGCHFNPLDAVRIGTQYEVKDVMNIATMIVDPDGKGLNDHWQKTGFALLTSVILHVLYAMPDKTLRGVAAYLNDPTLESVDVAFERMMQTEHDQFDQYHWKDGNGQHTSVHPVIAQSAREMLNKADNEKSGVISTMMSFLSLYRDPIVAKWTEYSDFQITDLQDADQPVSLYLVTSPEDKNRLKPLIRLVLNQVASQFTAEERLEARAGRINAKGKHRLLLLLDEFPSLGKLDIFLDSIAFLAGYNVKLYLITQDTAQLEDEHHGYGKSGAKTIIGNCHVRAAYAPNQVETAKWISDMLGTRTITLENDNKTFDGGLINGAKGYSTSINYQSRPLLTADEVMTLRGPEKEGSNIKKPGDMLVFVAGFSPIYAQQLLYFKNPEWLDRAGMPWPDRSDEMPGARKDYEAILGVEGGTLPVPDIPSKAPQTEKKEEAEPEITPENKEALAALFVDAASGSTEHLPTEMDLADVPNGEGKYDVSERDQDRIMTRAAMSLAGAGSGQDEEEWEDESGDEGAADAQEGTDEHTEGNNQHAEESEG